MYHIVNPTSPAAIQAFANRGTHYGLRPAMHFYRFELVLHNFSTYTAENTMYDIKFTELRRCL
jgi:hypothetical protein